MKILDFAIDVEQAEKELYQRLSECTENQSVKAIFRMIATKENILLDKLKALRQNPVHCQQEITRAPQYDRIQKNQNSSCELMSEQEICDDLSSYSYILRTENLVLNLYTNLKESINDPQAQYLLDLLLNEKRQEIDRISTLYDVARVIQ